MQILHSSIAIDCYNIVDTQKNLIVKIFRLNLVRVSKNAIKKLNSVISIGL